VQQAVSPAPKVPGAQNDGYLYTVLAHQFDDGRQVVASVWIYAKPFRAGQRFAADFEQDPMIFGYWHDYYPWH
jgi:hypothetical protein